MATATVIICRTTTTASSDRLPEQIHRPTPASVCSPFPSVKNNNKIVLQPRVCTLRSYGPQQSPAVVPSSSLSSSFFASLAEYIESTRRSQDLEILFGRLAMVTFAAAIGVESVTGNSLFKKLDLQQIAEAGGVCLAVVASAATFAWFSSAKTEINRMFVLGCNTFVDSLIDNIVDGLFYDTELSDWSDEMER